MTRPKGNDRQGLPDKHLALPCQCLTILCGLCSARQNHSSQCHHRAHGFLNILKLLCVSWVITLARHFTYLLALQPCSTNTCPPRRSYWPRRWFMCIWEGSNRALSPLACQASQAQVPASVWASQASACSIFSPRQRFPLRAELPIHTPEILQTQTVFHVFFQKLH